MSDTGYYSARFARDESLWREHCSANFDKIQMIGRHLKEQVRLEFPVENGIIPAVYTIKEVHQEEPDRVFVGNKISKFVKCLQLQNADDCKGEVKAQLTAEGLNAKQAEEYGDFIEELSDKDQNQKLVVIAPHGGEIEINTDKQAEIFGKEFSAEDVSLWICKGFDKGDKSAYERWHITATQINENSFPKLNTIYRRHFKYAIAFHGWTEDHICVGGSKNQTPPDLKVRVKNAIQEALLANGSDIRVYASDTPEGCPGGFNGDSEDNIVNRLGINGIQIEQCIVARKQYYAYIAKAVVDTIRPWIL
jgi:phage replication-related protein YjqB (UPF0714/DUF867 family)